MNFPLPRAVIFVRTFYLAKIAYFCYILGVVATQVNQAAFVPELSKAVTFFTSYPGEISHPTQLANQELSNDVSVVQEKLHFTPVHTLRQLKRDERLFPPLWRVVEF